MLEDSKTQVKILTEENQKLVDEPLALRLRDDSRARSKEGDRSSVCFSQVEFCFRMFCQEWLR